MTTEIIEHKSSRTMLMDSNAVNSYKEIAKLMSQALVQVPDHFKGKPADCLAVVMQAAQWQMNPYVVAQKTHIINGTLGYEAQLINAVVSSSNAIVGRFHYEYKGSREDWKPKWVKEVRNGKDHWKPVFSENAAVKVGAVLAGETDITWGEWIYPCDQTVFNSPLWRSNPKQQAGYLAVKFWARFYTPDVLLGAYTPDELHDYESAKDITPTPDQQKGSKVLNKLKGKTAQKQQEPIKEPEPSADIADGELIDPDLTDEALQRIADYDGAIMSGENLKKLAVTIIGDNLVPESEKNRLLGKIQSQSAES